MLNENKPVIKDHTLQNSIYMKYPEEEKLQRQRMDEWLPRTGKGGVEEEGWTDWERVSES